ncbi:4091_t:CDS:2, partial [Racocetra fulgida]
NSTDSLDNIEILSTDLFYELMNYLNFDFKSKSKSKSELLQLQLAKISIRDQIENTMEFIRVNV